MVRMLGRCKTFWTQRKVLARLKVALLFVAIVMFIKPLRNRVIPNMAFLYEDLSTLKLIRIHLLDLLYYMDRSPYQGSCQFVHDKLAPFKKPVLEEMMTYNEEDWKRGLAEIKGNIMSVEELEVLNNFRPTLTPREMKYLMYTTSYISLAFMAFNVTHFHMDGSLIATWRHHFMTPWDDDVDLVFDAEKWRLAKEIISCLPDIQLSMGSDYLWKAFHKDSDLWLGESFIKFPFVDIFPYNYDSEHIWSLTIWAKQDTLISIEDALPPVKSVFGGWPTMIPRRTGPYVNWVFGKVNSDCYSRTFLRREREMIPESKRYHFPCKPLHNMYPFVRRTKVDKRTNTVLEERVFRGKVLSSLNTTFYESYE